MTQLKSAPVAAAISCDDFALEGLLELPDEPLGVVIFVHGSGSSRHSPRNLHVAFALREAGFGTLLFDLLGSHEHAFDAATSRLGHDVELLGHRLLCATHWVRSHPGTGDLPVGYFGGGTGAAVALRAATVDGADVSAVVTRGGRPDLAGDSLSQVTAATLFIVGSEDDALLAANQFAFTKITAKKSLEIVLGSGPDVDEPGALGLVADSAATWFTAHLRAS